MLAGKVHSVEDGLLLAQLSGGSSQAFEALYDKYWSHVLDEAYRRLGDKNQAKDVAQEVFTNMWVRGTAAPIQNLPAWLYTVVKNQVYQQMKKQEYFVPVSELLSELESFGDRADAGILQKELLVAYETLIESLPEQQRIIFKMRYKDELTPDEIAAALHLSPKTVRNHLGRALTKLKATFLLIQLMMMITGK